MPKSGSGEPEGQPAEGNFQSGRRKNELAQRQSPKRCVPKSESGEPEGQLAKRKNQAAEGNLEAVRAEKRKP